MQWNADAHGGFTTGEPWLPLTNDYIQENVAKLSADTRSVLNLYRALIEFAKGDARARGRQLRARCDDRRFVGL
jgi:glycosidase